MSKTLEEQMLSCIENRDWEEMGAFRMEEKIAAKECTKVAQIYTLEQQIELLDKLKGQELDSTVVIYEIKAELSKQLKVLKDGKE